MSRDERPSGVEFASGLGQTRLSGETGGVFDSVPEAESIRFGCSMLGSIRFQPRHPGTVAAFRCSLGYALHDTDEVAKCLAVEGPHECWKMAPAWRAAPLERRSRERREPEPSAEPEPVPELDPVGLHIVELAEETGSAEPAAIASDDIALAEQAIARAAGVEPEEIVNLRTGTDEGGT